MYLRTAKSLMIQPTEGPKGSSVKVDVDASEELNERQRGSPQGSPQLEPSSRTGGTQPSCQAPPPSARSPKATLKLL